MCPYDECCNAEDFIFIVTLSVALLKDVVECSYAGCQCVKCIYTERHCADVRNAD
jgi:hypothetical protein